MLFASAASPRENPAAVSDYLHTLDPQTAARVAGSKAKREAILKGGSWEDMLNRKRPEAYRIGRLGDIEMRQTGAGLPRWNADARYPPPSAPTSRRRWSAIVSSTLRKPTLERWPPNGCASSVTNSSASQLRH
ncbi:MAG: hypothetical protein K9L65_05945 [Chromatiaceae bacterium]|nr:hypothetical protein [Chromatiaceae bacterium]